MARRRYPAAHDPRPPIEQASTHGPDYGRDRERYLVVASSGGAKAHPAWYLNLSEHPQVEVQVGADRFHATAATATADEKPRLWKQMVSIWPEYDRYQTKTEREIPVVVLTPSGR